MDNGNLLYQNKPRKGSLRLLWHVAPNTCLHLMSTEKVSRFIDRHIFLLSQERNAEVERSSLVFTKCGPKLLEQKGLALNGLGIANITVGLGNKTTGLSNWSARPHTTQSPFSPHIHFDRGISYLFRKT